MNKENTTKASSKPDYAHVLLECDTNNANPITLKVDGNPENAINLFVLGISTFIDKTVKEVLKSTSIKYDTETVQKNKDILLHIIFSNLLALNDRESKEAE